MHVWREDDSWAPGLYVCRQDPGNDGFVDMVKSQTSRKIAKLAPHQKAGATTVLLLETRCTALMSSEKMRLALEAAYPDGPPPGADQVWLADWSCESVPSYWRLR